MTRTVGRVSDEDPAVTPAGESDRHCWEEYVRAHPEGTFFHGWSWRAAVHRAFGHRPIYLIARRGDLVCGVLPFFLVKSVVAGRLLVSVPYAVYGGALVDDERTAELLLRETRALARRYLIVTADMILQTP